MAERKRSKTIDELIEVLNAHKEAFGGNAEVFMSNDSEGNDIKTIDGIFEVESLNEGDANAPFGPKKVTVIYPTDDIINDEIE